MKIKLLRNLKFILLFCLFIFSFICPFYIQKTNVHNLSFCIVEIPLFILTCILVHEQKKSNKMYNIILLIYFSLFLYYNIVYLKCYWAMIYKTSCFILINKLQQYDFSDQRVKKFFDYTINCCIYIFSFAVLASVFFRLILGIDAVTCNIFELGYRLNGFYSDSRLTWVFGHKSTYGMLDLFMIFFTLKNHKLKYRKYILLLLVLSLVLIDSVTAIIGFCIIFVLYFINDVRGNGGRKMRVLIVGMVGGTLGICGFLIISSIRNISSLGYRVYLWSAVPEILDKYSHGLGVDFFNTTWWVEGDSNFNGVMAQNFHNVYFNECLHYSVIVGVLFFVLVFFYPIKKIIDSKHKITNMILLVALSLPSIFDMAETDMMFPVWMLMLFAFTKYLYNDDRGKQFNLINRTN